MEDELRDRIARLEAMVYRLARLVALHVGVSDAEVDQIVTDELLRTLR